MASEAKALRKFDEPPPAGKLRPRPAGEPLKHRPPPLARRRRGTGTAALRPHRSRRAAPRRRRVHVPLELGVVTVMVRAAMVVLDFFEACPSR